MIQDAAIVFLHGFGGGPEDWDGVIEVSRERLPGRRMIAFALPGHCGGSQPDDCSLRSLASFFAGSPPVQPPWILVGYSLGGRISMRVAEDYPEKVSAMALISASPGIDDESERVARSNADAALSRRLESCRTKNELLDFWRDWTARTVFAGSRNHRSPDSLLKRLQHSPQSLARILREASPGVSECALPFLRKFRKPLAYFAGELDGKYVDIAGRIRESVPLACVGIVPGAGHAVLVDNPVRLGSLLADWLSSFDQ